MLERLLLWAVVQHKAVMKQNKKEVSLHLQNCKKSTSQGRIESYELRDSRGVIIITIMGVNIKEKC